MTLPSAAELLHPGEVQLSPDGAPSVPMVAEGAVPPPVPPPEPGEEATRFLPRARPGRYVVAAAVTAGALAGIAWGVASVGGASGAKEMGFFFAGIGATVVGIVAVVRVWRWAGRRRSGIPTRRSGLDDPRGEGPVE